MAKINVVAMIPAGQKQSLVLLNVGDDSGSLQFSLHLSPDDAAAVAKALAKSAIEARSAIVLADALPQGRPV
jgi:hypothetical protein